jgi:transposase InsO family protein
MREACSLVWSVLALLFRSRASLEAEILILRHQLNLQRRHLPKRLTFRAMDRLIFVGLYRLVPSTLDALTLVKPETVARWHRAGFRSYWRWKSRPRSGRPPVPAEIRRLIREMSIANPLWGAPRIHGELRKLGIEIGQTSVAKYMARRRGPAVPRLEDLSPQPCRRHRGDGSVRRADALLSAALWPVDHGHGRRQILWLGVTAHPTAEWIANQLTEACGWEQIPRYPIRDRDRAYGEIFVRRVRSIGIRDRPTSARSPWQNGYAERLIGSIRRECVDHIIVVGERHLRHVLLSYQDYYNASRTHLSLNKDAPVPRGAERAGNIVCRPILGGLHHHYARI